jgi:hypothetical protein
MTLFEVQPAAMERVERKFLRQLSLHTGCREGLKRDRERASV